MNIATAAVESSLTAKNISGEVSVGNIQRQHSMENPDMSRTDFARFKLLGNYSTSNSARKLREEKFTFAFFIRYSIIMDVINDIALDRIISAMTGSQNLGSSSSRRENTVKAGCSCGAPWTNR